MADAANRQTAGADDDDTAFLAELRASREATTNGAGARTQLTARQAGRAATGMLSGTSPAVPPISPPTATSPPADQQGSGNVAAAVADEPPSARRRRVLEEERTAAAAASRSPQSKTHQTPPLSTFQAQINGAVSPGNDALDEFLSGAPASARGGSGVMSASQNGNSPQQPPGRMSSSLHRQAPKRLPDALDSFVNTSFTGTAGSMGGSFAATNASGIRVVASTAR